MMTDGKRQSATKYFETATRIVPALAFLVGVGGSCVGAWYAVKSELTAIRRDVNENKGDVQTHINGYNHDNWFDADWIRHPTFRGALERREKTFWDRLQKERTKENLECLERIFELNPTLKKPNW